MHGIARNAIPIIAKRELRKYYLAGEILNIVTSLSKHPGMKIQKFRGLSYCLVSHSKTLFYSYV
jgi:hypothetical protein